jgi:hypothetical protein
MRSDLNIKAASNNVIPAPYQVRGRLSQARNDKPYKTYVVMYKY